MQTPSFDRAAFFREAAAAFRAALAETNDLSAQKRQSWRQALQDACDSCNATLSDPKRLAQYSPEEIEQLQAVEAALEALLGRVNGRSE
jgi:ABC-type transporter Mla subunit MlaD